MGYGLLWLETLAFFLLLTATVLSWAARLERPRTRRRVSVIVVGLPLCVLVVFTGLVGALGSRWFLSPLWLVSLVGLTCLYAAGAFWVLRRGLRQKRPEDGRPMAVSWPQGRLALGLAAVILLGLMTFWNLDLALQHELSVLRAEVGAKVLSAAPIRVADDQNGAYLYQLAFEKMQAPASGSQGQRQEAPGHRDPKPEGWDDRWQTWVSPSAQDFDARDSRLGHFLRRQESVVRLLVQAAAKPACWFGYDYYWPSSEMEVPSIRSWLYGAKILALQTRVATAEGDVRAALENTNALFSMARHKTNAPLLIDVVVGITIHRMGVDGLFEVLSKHEVSPDLLDLVRLREGVSHAREFERVMAMEEAFCLGAFCEAASNRSPGLFGDGGLSGAFRAIYRVFLLRGELAAYRRIGSKYRKLAAEPFHRVKAQWSRLEDDVYSVSHRGIVTRLVVVSVTHVASRVTDADARHHAARLLLALHRYRATHRAFPQRLDDLVPAFVNVVPTDPFDGQPLRLVRSRNALRLYSVGPDGKDDGGTPLADGEGDIVFEVVGH